MEQWGEGDKDAAGVDKSTSSTTCSLRNLCRQSLHRKLEKAGNNAEEREKILKEFGNEMGRLVLTQGRGRGGARKGDEVQ